MTIKNKEKLYIAFGLVAFFGLMALFVFSGDNFQLLKSIFIDDLSSEQISSMIDVFDWHDYVMVIILALLQVVCVVLPAEPVQVLAGLSFGFPVGVLCCMAGVLLGNTTIFLLYRIFGNQLHGFFVKKLHLDLDKIAKSNKCVLLIFILYFLPAIPYGMICFFAASTGMRYRRFILVTLLGSLPSVCIGVGLGYITVALDGKVAVAVFAVLLLILALAFIKRDALFSKLNSYADANKAAPKNVVRKTNGVVLGILYHTIKFYYFLCGVRIKKNAKIKKIEKPSILLCNHGSFIDFIFAGALVRKYKPNFIAARLYFYDRVLSWLLRSVGSFPKSMFALDTESTKNCLRVLKSNGILAMMPEARLSTTGRFEDIQGSTYTFIKKSAVPVYTIKFSGDYFADPKWGKGFRRGSIVEAELDILYTAQEVQSLSVEEIRQGIEERLYYNEFEWLKNRPDLRYRSPRMAEGIENILSICPICHKKHTITTKKDKIFCEKCGYLTSLDDRYAFTGNFRFKNLTEWYDWQFEIIKEEISQNRDYSLVSEVELRLPSNGRGLTRSAGYGVCTLNRDGLKYRGTKDGENVELQFSLSKIYRLLFGAGENFEIYNGTEILYFVPKEKRSAVEWYMTSMILHDQTDEVLV